MLPWQIDTARGYANGTSEEYLGKLDYEKRGLVMGTKLYPIVVRPMVLYYGRLQHGMLTYSCYRCRIPVSLRWASPRSRTRPRSVSLNDPGCSS